MQAPTIHCFAFVGSTPIRSVLPSTYRMALLRHIITTMTRICDAISTVFFHQLYRGVSSTTGHAATVRHQLPTTSRFRFTSVFREGRVPIRYTIPNNVRLLSIGRSGSVLKVVPTRIRTTFRHDVCVCANHRDGNLYHVLRVTILGFLFYRSLCVHEGVLYHFYLPNHHSDRPLRFVRQREHYARTCATHNYRCDRRGSVLFAFRLFVSFAFTSEVLECGVTRRRLVIGAWWVVERGVCLFPYRTTCAPPSPKAGMFVLSRSLFSDHRRHGKCE